MTELIEMTEIIDEMILWGSIVFIAILLSNSKVYKVFLLLILLCFCLGTNSIKI